MPTQKTQMVTIFHTSSDSISGRWRATCQCHCVNYELSKQTELPRNKFGGNSVQLFFFFLKVSWVEIVRKRSSIESLKSPRMKFQIKAVSAMHICCYSARFWTVCHRLLWSFQLWGYVPVSYLYVQSHPTGLMPCLGKIRKKLLWNSPIFAKWRS